MDFQIFTLFFLSVDAVCETYSQEIFRKRSSEAVSNLQVSVETTSESLDLVSDSLNQMTETQFQFMKNFGDFALDAKNRILQVIETTDEINKDQHVVLDQQDHLFSQILQSRSEIRSLSSEIEKSLAQVQSHEAQIHSILNQVQTIDSILSGIGTIFSLNFLGQIIVALLLFFVVVRIIWSFNVFWIFDLLPLSRKHTPKAGRSCLTNSQLCLLEKILTEHR